MQQKHRLHFCQCVSIRYTKHRKKLATNGEKNKIENDVQQQHTRSEKNDELNEKKKTKQTHIHTTSEEVKPKRFECAELCCY